MTAPTPNAGRAYAVLDQIDAHPELWFQGWYFTRTDCGTAGCFAGWTSLLAGDKPSRTNDDTMTAIKTDGTLVAVHSRAMELLGINDWQASALFNGFNTRERLGELVAEIFGERPLQCAVQVPHPPHDWLRPAEDETAHCQGVTGNRNPHALDGQS